MRIGIGESFAQQCVGTFEHRPPTTRASLSSNDSNRRSRRLCRRLWASPVFDQLASGYHRRGGHAGATPGGAYGAYKFATNGGGGGYGPGYTGNVGNVAYVATFRLGKVQPLSPSACHAAASRSVRHSA